MKMKTETMNWVQIVSNFSLLIGMVLVAVQINQSSNIARAQLAHDAWLNSAGELYAVVGENPAATLAKANLSEEELTDEELFVLNAYFDSATLHMARIAHMQRLGLAIYSDDETALAFAPAFAGRFGNAWWAVNRERTLARAPEIASRIDELLVTDQIEDLASDLRRLRARLERSKSMPDTATAKP